MNKLIAFDDVTSENFESLLRRLALVKIRALFYDAGVLEEFGGEKPDFGVFRRDPHLADFLTSGPAAAAAHKIQLAFEERHNEQAEHHGSMIERTSSVYHLGMRPRSVSIPLTMSSDTPGLPQTSPNSFEGLSQHHNGLCQMRRGPRGHCEVHVHGLWIGPTGSPPRSSWTHRRPGDAGQSRGGVAERE